VLAVCATPIGNLGDAPPRLADILDGADVVMAEDTRRAKVLLDALGVGTPVLSYFVGNEAERAEEVARRLSAGETVALLTDAGTPAISDPGLSAVRAARGVGARVTVVPGPSAVTAILSVSGLPSERFVFEGFLPRKGAERRGRLELLAREERTTVFFSAPSRLVDDLSDLTDALGGGRPLVVGRELTKLHEEIWFGTLDGALAEWGERRPRGEFTLVLGGAAPVEISLADAIAEVRRRVDGGEPLSAVVRDVAQVTGLRRRVLYEASLRNPDDA
jgi:16S rRNA (cytidine1402-2'-O)-methyltransferase